MKGKEIKFRRRRKKKESHSSIQIEMFFTTEVVRGYL